MAIQKDPLDSAVDELANLQDSLYQILAVAEGANAQDLGDCYERLCDIIDLCNEALG